MDNSVFSTYYYGQVSCIDRQIADLEARRDAMLAGTCFIGYVPSKTYIDPYNLDDRPKKEI